jgi:hypothetical protein
MRLEVNKKCEPKANRWFPMGSCEAIDIHVDGLLITISPCQANALSKILANEYKKSFKHLVELLPLRCDLGTARIYGCGDFSDDELERAIQESKNKKST